MPLYMKMSENINETTRHLKSVEDLCESKYNERLFNILTKLL